MSEPWIVPDGLAPEQARALDGLIGAGLTSEGELPPLWHWVYFLDRPAQSELGPDGHPRIGRPTPPEPGLRRMFAGGRVTTRHLLRLGEPATARTTVGSPTLKQSRSGPLWFVTVQIDYEQAGRVAISEERDIVYRAAPQGPTPMVGQRAAATLAPLPAEAAGDGLDLAVDETVLFRFSALTYNAHRIHYDLAWAEHEGYGGLVVHGPLQGLLMAELCRRGGDHLLDRTFSYRLVSPCVGTQLLRVRSAEPQDDALRTVAVYDAGGVVTARASLGPAQP